MRRPRRKTYVCFACGANARAGYRAVPTCGACSRPMHRKGEPPPEPAPPVDQPDGIDPVTARLVEAIAVLAAAPNRAAVRDLLWEAGITD